MTDSKGFSLIETAVALAVFSIIAAALVSFILTHQSTSLSAKNKSRAARFAEEALEISRSLRSQSSNWNNFYSAYPAGDYYVSANNLLPCSGSCPQISGSIFTRTVKIERSPATQNQIIVTVLVSWQEKNKPKQTESTTYLSNWQANESYASQPADDPCGPISYFSRLSPEKSARVCSPQTLTWQKAANATYYIVELFDQHTARRIYNFENVGSPCFDNVCSVNFISTPNHRYYWHIWAGNNCNAWQAHWADTGSWWDFWDKPSACN